MEREVGIAPAARDLGEFEMRYPSAGGRPACMVGHIESHPQDRPPALYQADPPLPRSRSLQNGKRRYRPAFPWPAASTHHDIRTFQVKQLIDGTDPVDLYKVRHPHLDVGGRRSNNILSQFNHPNTGTHTGVTSIERRNQSAQRWENAGHIDWSSDANGNVYFGMEKVTQLV